MSAFVKTAKKEIKWRKKIDEKMQFSSGVKEVEARWPRDEMQAKLG